MLDVDIKLHLPKLDLEYAFRTEAPITGVFGRSGAGKTTLLHLVAGLVKPTSGRIRFGDETLYDSAAGVDAPTHRRRLAVVFQDDRLFPHYTVLRNLHYGRRHADNHLEQVPFDDVIDLLKLNRLLKRRIGNLSGGERQRVSLGRALLSSPALMLLDEPLSSLDREHKQQILGLIQQVRDVLHVPMLYVSHDLTELLQLTDRLLVIDNGRTVGHGPLREVIQHAGAWRAMHDLGPANVLRAKAASHDREAGLTKLVLDEANKRFLVGPLNDLPEGATLHISIPPEDIALALARVPDVSIQNQLPGRIVEITRHADRSIAAVDIGAPLLVEVSHRTVKAMELSPGREIWCLIKSNAIAYVG